MTGQSFVPLPGSERGPLPQSQELGPVDESRQIEVTLVTRHRAPVPRDLVEGPATLTPEQFAEEHGTDPADLELITTTLAGHGLQVTGADPGARRVMVRGTVAALSATFGATLRLVRTPDPGIGPDTVEHRYREGALRIPAELARHRGRRARPGQPASGPRAVPPCAGGRRPGRGAWCSRPGPRRPVPGAPAPGAPAPGGPAPAAPPAAASTSYTPPQVAALYQFPAGTDGTGQTIAIIELGGGSAAATWITYFSGLGLPVPSVTAASVDGAVNQPGQDPSGADGEVLLDIEVAGRRRARAQRRSSTSRPTPTRASWTR